MAHGTRGRLALLGTGLLFCIGCLEPDPKPISKAGSQTKSPNGQFMSGGGVNTNAGLNGSSVRTPTGGNSTFGSGVQQAGFNTPGGRPTPNNNYFNTPGSGSIGAPAIPGAVGNGASMAPSNVVPPVTPSGYSGAGYQGAVVPQLDPYAAGRPTMAPPGFENAMPPAAPGGPAYPQPPSPPSGALNPYGK